jgi:predicted aldo/keto reductase-like oxidoreductase
MNYRKSTRRQFLKASTIAPLGLSFTSCSREPVSSSQEKEFQALGEVPRRPLGSTGEEISLLGMGGYHIGVPRNEQDCIRLIRSGIDAGVTFLDNAWGYHDGRSEVVMGKALRDGYREKAFVMTKHHGRDKATAMRHLEDSLTRLQIEVIDLWQFHEIIYEKDCEMIFAPGGAIEAAEQAKRDGKVRFIGFTGHKDPRFHRMMLEQDYPWDAVQMPLSPLDSQFERSFEQEILPICQERGIGVVAMKALAGGHLLRANVLTPRQAHQYVYGLPIATLVSGMENLEKLASNIEIVSAELEISEQERESILARAADAAKTGEYEPFKTTNRFDSRTGRELHGLV